MFPGLRAFQSQSWCDCYRKAFLSLKFHSSPGCTGRCSLFSHKHDDITLRWTLIRGPQRSQRPIKSFPLCTLKFSPLVAGRIDVNQGHYLRFADYWRLRGITKDKLNGYEFEGGHRDMIKIYSIIILYETYSFAPLSQYQGFISLG